MSPRQSAELLWSRFINYRGILGHNIPNDLHMEHLNRLIKTSLKGLGANNTQGYIYSWQSTRFIGSSHG